MRRKKRKSVDVELYDSEYTYDDLLKMVDDSGSGDVDLDLKLIAEFNRVSEFRSLNKYACFQVSFMLGHPLTLLRLI